MNNKQETKNIANIVGAHDCARKNQNILRNKIANIVGAGPVPARDHRGITLVALIITVIVMLILLGVTVNIALNGGLFGMTKEAVKKTEIAAYKEKIDAVRINIIVEQISKGLADKEFMDRYEEELRKDKNFEGSEITREGETIILITKEGYKFIITEEGTNYEGDTNAPENPKTPPNLTENDITYDKETWTQGPVMVSIREQIKEDILIKGYTLKYQKNEGTVQDYSGPIEMTEKGTINIQLIDSETNKVVKTVTANITKIDTEAPEINTHLSANATNVVGEVELSIEVTDNLSGLSTIKWHYKPSGGTDGIVTKEYTEMYGANAGETETKEKTEKITGLTPGETYSMYAEVYDVAGKSTRSPETGIVSVTIPLPSYAEAQKDETNGVLKTNATYTSDGKTAIVPKGFKVIQGIGGTTSINDGLVIQDKDENEFVWIPVDDINKFVRSTWSNNERDTILDNEASSSYREPLISGGYTNEKAEYDAMVASVSKNKGFYIGRYEAGSIDERTDKANGTTTMVVKQGVAPYNYVAWGNSMSEYTENVFDASERDQGKGALYLSKHMYDGEGVGVTSTLCYGVQWDTMLEFIKKDKKDVTNSISWGNYKDKGNALAVTGSSDTYSAKNIYDVAGNVWETTMEASSSGVRVNRGGGYNGDGSTRPASYRSSATEINRCNAGIGFRVALYIK